jgi:transcriptional regulator with XRE-family HTH domain
MHWGAYITDARMKASLTVEELAARSGFETGLIEDWEYERQCPRIDDWVKVLAAAGFAPAVRLVEDDGVDIAQIERHLAMTPAERLRNLRVTAAFVERAQAAKRSAQSSHAIRS